MKIQPVDHEPVVLKQPVPVPAPAKWRLKRLFEGKFAGVLKGAPAERVVGDLEPSSVCLGKMVQNFLEEGSEKTSSRCGRTRCNCFNGKYDDGSDADEDESFFCGEQHHGEAHEIIKSLVVCVNTAERNLLADVSKTVEICRSRGSGKIDRKVLVQALVKIGYDAAVCKSKGLKTSAFPAGVYEYVDVNMEGGERLLVDVDFKSEFEMLRSTKAYRNVLQALPAIFVGKTDRLQQIVAVVCEAAKQSMKRKGLHFPPWRSPEYMRSKWVSPFERFPPSPPSPPEKPPDAERLDQRLGKKSGELFQAWQVPAVEPKAATSRGGKMVTGILL